MALAQHRIVLHGDSPYPHETEAIAFAEAELPNSNPFLVWELVELHEGSSGRLYEIDLLVLGYSALYLVEIKSGPGTYKGDCVDWYRDVPGEPPRYMECPYRLTNTKAKALGSLIQRKLGNRAPWVQPIIFLSHPDAKLSLRADGMTGVVTRATFKRAFTHHEFPNSDPRWRADPIPEPLVRDLSAALQQAGIRARKGRMHVGPYELGKVIEEGSGSQDRLATHRATKTIQRRARTYLVPQQTSVERRQALRRAADREAVLLNELRDHAGILRFSEYVEDAPLGPTVLFEPFDGERLDAFVRRNDNLSFSDRIEIIKQLGNALAFCHRKEILHGGLNPEAALVRRTVTGGIEVRLYNFQLASATDGIEPTAHVSAWIAQPMLVYQAPELREDPTARSPQSDIFSLGAVAYFVLTGQAPAPDAVLLDARLAVQGGLDPRAADDRIPAEVADVIKNATSVSWSQRFDDTAEWVQFLEDAATAPDPASRPAFADPLSAAKGDRLSDDLDARGTLGQGASARVLRVYRRSDDTEYALKVSLSAEHDERIRAEGQALGRFRHARIVEKLGDLELAGRACILLSIAGTTTLQRRLQQEGPATLDYAWRWGEDLLSAVEYLEEEGVTHRDIKPANLGIGATGKRANHLTLFDFSLVLSEPTALDAGTVAYRDPFLRARGAWDAAADRWSAAVTLHEMLAGARPTYGGPNGSTIDAEAKLTLAAERFDAGIRDRLVGFFEKALAREVGGRFGSASAMRRAWTACFAEASTHPPAVQPGSAASPAAEPTPPAVVTDDDVRRITQDAPIDTLPLSIGAKNALDRAGVARARDLNKLPANRVSAIRGVGARIVHEILDFRTRWQALRGDSDVEVTPFFPGYRGENLALVAAGLPEALVAVLSTAGLPTYAVLASAPEEQVATLARRAGLDVAPVRSALDREHRAAEERDHPTTLEGWCSALLPAKKRGKRPATAAVVRVLFGLDAPAAGKPRLAIGASANDAADAYGVTSANVYICLGRARGAWQAHPAITELVAMTRGLVEASGGALPLREGADQLPVRVPYDRSRPAADVQADAAALLRVAADVDREAETPELVQARVGGELWLLMSSAHVSALKALASVADQLAMRTPLASAPETQAALREAAEGTPLAVLPVERLTALAARASTKAACSTRFEMYPRNMDARRAIELTASVLTGDDLAPDAVRKRVKDRYPEAAEIPDRPELDELLKPYGLHWTGKRYERQGEESRTRFPSIHTTFERYRTALPEQPRDGSPEALASAEIDARIMTAVERRQLRVVLVRSDLVALAIPHLAARLSVRPQRVDRLLIAAMERHAHAEEIDLTVLHETHEAGSEGADWPRLVDLAGDAMGDVAASLLPAGEPLVLSHFGLVRRYSIQRFLDALAAAATRDDCEAIFLVHAAHDESTTTAMEGLRIPGLLPSQVIRITKAWIENRHNAAAPAA